MVDFQYLYKGLCALARAHQVNTMSGHLGAALVAGYFIGEQNPDLNERVIAGIESDLDRIIDGESVFSPRANAVLTAADMFVPFPEQSPREDLIDGIAEALLENIGEARQSGHNVIFAALTIRALKDHPEFATPAITDGIRRLIQKFNDATPGNGYYGAQRGRIDGRRVPLDETDATPAYSDLPGMATIVLNELVENGGTHRQGFGDLVHLVNHAAALCELATYGYREVAHEGMSGHWHHFRLWRTLPDVSDELGALEPAAHDVRSPEFWDENNLRYDRARLTHRVKTLYGFDALAAQIEAEDLRLQAHDQLRFHL